MQAFVLTLKGLQSTRWIGALTKLAELHKVTFETVELPDGTIYCRATGTPDNVQFFQQVLMQLLPLSPQ